MPSDRHLWAEAVPPHWGPSHLGSPGQAVALVQALPQGVLAADEDLLRLRLAGLGLEVVLVVGQGLQREQNR